MIEVGMRVQFVPYFLDMQSGWFPKKPEAVVGRVIFVNPKKEFFVVEYSAGNGVLREGLQFFDIGRRCSTLRPRKGR